MNIQIHTDVLETFPDAAVTGSVIQCSSLAYAADIPAEENQHLLLDENWGPYGINTRQEVKRWRNVYKHMGVKPSKFLSSFESLFKQYKKGKNVFGIHPIVDIYNYISLKHRLCIGAYDLDKINGNVHLRFADQKAEERMVPIGSNKPIPLHYPSVVYSDDRQVICALWNHKDADSTKIDTSSKKILLCIDHNQNEKKRADKALNELKDMLLPANNECIIEEFYLDAKQPTCAY
ncbi:lysyl-tRNA synthetase, class 2 [Alteribacillus persepolensis]|uniref:Lysyl-tRNA synthetase, class 2 n=1 Tax=Alteribacillus persepolensis TaxID=568899 RepID=A0A1G8ED50_9BACI|nr:phenylalanine--tRNA ligase beta subunit-related protein [Alteribacillus persepolensis]SDH67700.1 lysyl-tRNA synthetase, class 2 [Alteribacillus persepolensis]